MHRFMIMALTAACVTLSAAQEPPRTDFPLDAAWTFALGDTSDAPADPAFALPGGVTVSLPHTWNGIDGQDGGGDYRRGTGWYRKTVRLEPSTEGKQLYLQFDGANAVTTVFVNGRRIGTHRGGFARFRFDVTRVLKQGADNLIAVKVSNAPFADVPPLDADFTFYGGIYRHVHLIATRSFAFSCMDMGSSGLAITQSNVGPLKAELRVQMRIANHGPTGRTGSVRTRVLDKEGVEVAGHISPLGVSPNSDSTVVHHILVRRPHLWDGRNDPYLYRVVAEVREGDRVTDIVSAPLGVRSFSIDGNKGFILNGRSYDLHGVNKHQDRPRKGWAISERDMDEDFDLMKEIGATAIRLAHYQHPQHEYDLADSLGFIVWAEIPLVNRITPGHAFAKNAVQQLRELIRQNINHPSIVFWGIANEVTLREGMDPNPLLKTLAAEVKREDPTRLSGIASAAGDNDRTDSHTDVTGFNKYFGWYYDSLAAFAKWADRIQREKPRAAKFVGVTEYGAGASIAFHADSVKAMDHTEEYQCLYHETYWKAMGRRPFLWGTFVWNMFDFAVDSRNEGDTPGRNDKGLVTFDRRIRKDAFFWYKANWTPEPMVHITGRRFNPRASAFVTVKVYSNMATVELLVNGTSLGIRQTSSYITSWEGVPLAVGQNRVEARGRRGEEVVVDHLVWDH
jgi:beta-galactosidase